jgi:hypothetical protein
MNPIKYIRAVIVAALTVSCITISLGYAEECPTAKSASEGFVVQRGERSKTEVFHVGETDVRTVYRVDGRSMLEVTLFQGLFDLDRLDRGKRSAYRPVSDLDKFFPPAPGKKITAIFEETEGERKGNLRTFVLEVRKEPDTLSIGACEYKVLRIDRSVMDSNNKPVFMETDYYAPDLKLVIGKEYRESDGRTSLNKFDRIYLSSR